MFHSKNATYFFFFAQVRCFWCWSVYSGSASTRYLRAGARCARDTAAQQVTLRGLKSLRAGEASGRPPPTAAACGGIESHTPFSLFVLEIFTTNHEYQEGKRSSCFENPSSASEGQSAGPDPRWGERGCRRRSRPRTSSEPSRWRMRTRTRMRARCDPCSVPGFRFATSG